MEKSAAAVAAAGLFVGWDEVFVSNDKGKRVVHYYLNRRDGGSDLAVVGKEKSLRHMSYYYALRNRSLLLSLAPSSSSLLKLRSRRNVVDWLSSIVPDSPSLGSSQVVDGSLDREDGHDADVPAFKDLHLRKLEHHSKEFSWLGPSESGRKRRRHYQSFCRNGITISVHDFVYIMAEENKRLVAYLEDLYEDSKGNKMVVVQWFHKIDEVDTVLPAKFNGREIFFSLSRQDLSVECIDGLATILSPQHFEKFLNEATHTRLEPFVCHNMVENDDVMPFDITQVQGYWKQEIIKYMYTTSHRRTSVKPDHVGLDMEVEGNDSDDAIRTRPKKRRRLSKSGEVDKQRHSKMEARDTTCVDIQKSGEELAVSSSGAETCAPKEGRSATALSRKETISQRSHQHLAVGSHVEVLSQDSGIRGCWFRALILKKQKDKVKVRYEDIRDAADEALNLEEWILASKVAVPDHLGLRLGGRTTLRPYPLSNIGRVFDVGTSVDAWWCDGWWEGIVLQKESEDKIHVYFPGERRTSIFAHGDLRHSQDWVGNEWKCIKGRPDIVRAVLSGIENKQEDGKPCDGRSHPVHVAVCENQPVYGSFLSKDDKDACNKSSFLPKELKVSSSNKSNPHLESRDDGRKEMLLVPNLANDDLLAQLKWKSSRKRRHRRERMQRRGGFDSNRNFDGFSSSSPEDIESPPRERFIIPKSLKLDHDNCKYRDDSLFNASITPLASLVMSR